MSLYFLLAGEEEMVEIQIPITQATVLILFGTAVVVASIIGLFAVGPFFSTSREVTLYLLSWFFLFFGSLFIFMGVRRAKPV